MDDYLGEKKMVLMKKWQSLLKTLKLSNSSLIRRFIVSYAIILVIPLVITGVFIFSSITGMMSREIQDSTLNNIFQARDIIDMRLRELNHTAVNLLQNPVILPIINAQDIERLNEYNYYCLVRELKNYRYTNAFFDDIYIYFRNSDTIVGSDGKYRMSLFYGQAFRYQRTSWSELKTVLDNVSETLIKPVETVYIDNTPKQLLTYLMPIPINDTKFKETLMITVDASSINKIIRNVLGENKGQVRVFDQTGRLIALADNENTLTEDDLKPLLQHKLPVYEKEVKGRRQMVFNLKSTQTGWSYLAVLPSDQILIRVNRMKQMSIFILMISMIIGGCLIYYFSYWNFDPIKQICETISAFDKTPRARTEPQNELDIIGTVLKTTIAKNIDLEKRLQEQLPVIKADFLRSLLKGGYVEMSSVNKMCEFLKLGYLKGPFAVMVFAIDDSDEFAGQNPESPGGLYKFSLANVVEELCREIGAGYAVNIDGGDIALIIDFCGNDFDQFERMETLGVHAIELFEKHFDFTLTVGVGRVYNQVTDIVKSQVDANTAVEYKMVMGKNKVIIYDSIGSTKKDRLYYPLQSEAIIFNALKNGDFNVIRKVLTATIENIMKEPVDIIVARCIYFEIVNTAMKALTELELEDYTEIMAEGSILPNLLRCQTLSELYEQVVTFYKTICDRIKSTKVTKELTFQNCLLEYVKTNFADPNLSLILLAKKFKLTPTYLSRFFKKKTQYNFVEYLHRLRLKKAKQLLEDTDKNIAEIAVEIGYFDSHSLIRAFKKYESITPGKFREVKASS